MLIIGILQADTVMEQFQPDHGDYPGMFEGMLGAAADSLDIAVAFKTYDVEHGEYPEDLNECDAYVITGSKKSVYDDEDWIRALGGFVKSLHESRKKTVGICFGHQLAAHFLGGKAGSAAVGWGVGIHGYDILSPKPFMRPALDKCYLLTSHKDQVLALPAGAELLAGSDFCPHAIFQLGDHMLCIQGHPEFQREYAADLMKFREDILGPQTYAEGMRSLEGELSGEDVGRWIVNFLSAS